MKNIRKRGMYFANVIAFALSLLVMNIPMMVGATSSSAWFSTNNPTITQFENPSSLPSVADGQPCQYMNIKTKKRTIYSNSETWASQCVRTMPYGFETGSSLLQIGDVAGSLKDYNNKSALIPIPGTNDIFSISSASYGSYYSFNRNFTNHLTTTLGGINQNWDGTVSYKINTAPGAMISDAAEHALKLNYGVMGFSNNGRYMVIDAPYVALLRVDTSTGVVTPFGAPFTYFNGNLSKIADVAISNDGQFAFVSGQNRLQVYDLSTCASVPSTITGPVTCDSKNFYSLWTGTVPTASGFGNIGFNDDDTLYGYAHFTSPLSDAKYFITSYGHSITTHQYLALGDSYSSGEGAYNYELGTDVHDNKCHLSTLSYPYLISASQSYSTFHSVACSGATSDNVINGVPRYPNVPTPNSLGDWMPGTSDQMQKLRLANPNIVTVGIGGNDIDFAGIVRRCTFDFSGTCYSSNAERLKLVDLIDNQYANLRNEYQQIKGATKQTAKIYVIGYPQVANPSGTHCGNSFLNTEEIALSNQIVNHLNYVIQQAAIAAGVQYIDVSGALNGHQLCDPASSNIAVNGMTVGQEKLHIIGAESFHPNLLGQTLLKKAIMNATSNFGTYTPGTPSAAVTPDRTSTSAVALLGTYTTPTSGTISLPVPVSELPDTAYKDTGLSFVLNHNHSTLAPNTTYTVTLHSTPTTLGTYTTDASGDLTVSASIPSSVDNGVHLLSITGTNLAGQAVEAYQTIAIGQTENDFNGDSVTDAPGTCVFNTGTATDVDQDDIDDLCDPVRGRSPTDINSLYHARQGNPANGESASSLYIERNVSLASSLLGITDYDADSDGWSVIGVTGSGQDATYANLTITDAGLTENTYDEYVPTVSGRSATLGCAQFALTSLAPVTSTSSTAVSTKATNANTCRTAAANADVDSNTIADNLDTLYRMRTGNTTLGESSSDTFIERNVNTSEAVLGISDYDDNGDGWAKIATFSTAYSYATIGLLDPSNSTVITNGSAAFTTTLLAAYTAQQRQAIVPVIALSDGTTCYNYKPDNLGFVALGQTRSASLLTTNVVSCSP
jgi:hypothetical protein